MSKLKEAADIIVNDCMAIKGDETVLIIVDKPLRKIGQTILTVAKEVAEEAILTEITSRDNHGVEPPACIANLMQQVDVVVMPTSKSLSHTKARKAANKAGARAATLPAITEDIMVRTLNADYKAIGERSEHVAKLLDKGTKAHLTTELGTDITMSLRKRGGNPDTGIYHETGVFGNLPAGEAFIAPLEGTAEGKVVVDGTMSGLGVLDEPFTLVIEDGYVVDIQGGKEADELSEILEKYGKKAKNIAELGIGTNDQATLSGNVLEDEKVMGTVHLAIGDNSAFGGEVEVESHLDGIIKQPTLKIDGEIIMKKGEWEIF
ncbi:aminopeptidase [Sporohalobacter salinus]|uniref:aminopeptidase n=1 Tax=Sporohalobacter salinus TaxID=1494606 RepID=UPI001961401F|nr:aminopeptidase [Sporohalobacter salinus]MBM7623181.1 leucyl aminopeptidase (aminopeptidase T) [Sporohalobacter salinus]